MFIFQIRLAQEQDAEAFVTFMREEYFPALLGVGPTRVGQVTDVTLLERESKSDDARHEFFLHVGWNGLAIGEPVVRDAEVTRKLDGFGAKIDRLGFYAIVASRGRKTTS